jgi:hypothetical protein
VTIRSLKSWKSCILDYYSRQSFGPMKQRGGPRIREAGFFPLRYKKQGVCVCQGSTSQAGPRVSLPLVKSLSCPSHTVTSSEDSPGLPPITKREKWDMCCTSSRPPRSPLMTENFSLLLVLRSKHVPFMLFPHGPDCLGCDSDRAKKG